MRYNNSTSARGTHRTHKSQLHHVPPHERENQTHTSGWQGNPWEGCNNSTKGGVSVNMELGVWMPRGTPPQWCVEHTVSTRVSTQCRDAPLRLQHQGREARCDNKRVGPRVAHAHTYGMHADTHSNSQTPTHTHSVVNTIHRVVVVGSGCKQMLSNHRHRRLIFCLLVD